MIEFMSNVSILQKENKSAEFPSNKSIRFVPTKSGNVCQLSGHINESIKFEAYSDVIASADIIDFLNISDTTWFGVRNFFGFLQIQNKPFRLRNVSTGLIHQLLFVLKKSDLFFVESFFAVVYELSWLEAEKPSAFQKQSLIQVDRLKKHWEAGNSFILLSETERVKGALHHFLRLSDPSEHLVPRFTVNPDWNRENGQVEANFWYEYCSFLSKIFEICIKGIDSLSVTLIEKMRNLCFRISGVKAAVMVVDSSFITSDDDELKNVKQAMYSISSLVASIDMKCIGFDQMLCQMELFLSDKCYTGSRSELYGILTKCGNFAKDQLQPMSGSIEQHGTNLSLIVCSLFSSSDYVKHFQSLTEETCTPDQLRQMREKLFIMDVISEGDIDASKDLFLEELQSLDSELMNCMVELQSFDAVRQIIEHRIRESEFLAAVLPSLIANEVGIHFVKSELLTLAGEKLVTDQEKAAYEFYFPRVDGLATVKEEMDSGEINFF
jgi:hypothetical protein